MRYFTFVILAALFAFVGCDNDPTGAGSDPVAEWKSVDLPPEINSSVIDFGFGADRTVASSTVAENDVVSEMWILEYVDGEWALLGDTPLPRAKGDVPWDIAVDGLGQVHVVGGRYDPGRMVVWSESASGWQVAVADDYGSGVLQAAEPMGSEGIIAMGSLPATPPSAAAPLAIGIAGGISFGTVPLPPDADGVAVSDLSSNSSALFALGWTASGTGEDAHYEKVVMQYESEAWLIFPRASENPEVVMTGIDATDEYVFASGYVDGGENPDTAWLSRYSITESSWTEIPMPPAEEIGQVSAPLAARDGNVYLTGGSYYKGATLVSLPATLVKVSPDGEAAIEWSDAAAAVWALGELADGTVVAGGSSGEGDQKDPLLLERR